MDSIAPQLPKVLGSSAALMVAAINFMSDATPTYALVRVTAAYVVFASFGVVMRYLLGDIEGSHNDKSSIGVTDADGVLGDDIVPGTSVGDLLGTEEYHAVNEVGGPSAE